MYSEKGLKCTRRFKFQQTFYKDFISNILQDGIHGPLEGIFLNIQKFSGSRRECILKKVYFAASAFSKKLLFCQKKASLVSRPEYMMNFLELLKRP